MKYAVTDRSDLGNGSDNAVFGGNKSVKNYFYSLGMRGHLINYPVLLPVGIFHRENSVRDTYSFTGTFAENVFVLHINELVFERGTSGIDN